MENICPEGQLSYADTKEFIAEVGQVSAAIRRSMRDGLHSTRPNIKEITIGRVQESFGTLEDVSSQVEGDYEAYVATLAEVEMTSLANHDRLGSWGILRAAEKDCRENNINTLVVQGESFNSVIEAAWRHPQDVYVLDMAREVFSMHAGQSSILRELEVQRMLQVGCYRFVLDRTVYTEGDEGSVMSTDDMSADEIFLSGGYAATQEDQYHLVDLAYRAHDYMTVTRDDIERLRAMFARFE